MKSALKLSALIILTIGLLSCEKVKRNAEQLNDKVKAKTKEQLEKQVQRVVDKVFPPFNHDEPDTENNKNRFKDFLKNEITPDVKNIYCFDDAVGIDADYMFSFDCNSATSEMIISIHGLTIDTINTDNGFGFQHDFDWWDKKKIAKLQKYSWTNGDQYFKYYWYDKQNEKAYFFDFDI